MPDGGTGVLTGEGSGPLAFLEDHSLSEITQALGRHLGIGVDAISTAMLISRAAGSFGMPINLAIYSDDPGAEQMIADRVINILPESVKYVETPKQLRDLADAHFEDTEVVLVRTLNQGLYRLATESACRDTAQTSPPSVWLITDDKSQFPMMGPTLALMAMQTERSLVGFGHHFSMLPDTEVTLDRKILRQLLLQLKHRRRYACPFQEHLRSGLKAIDTLTFNRVLCTIAALRIELGNTKGQFQAEANSVITIEDYRVTRSLLINLPIPPRQSQLSPYAAEAGAILFDAFVNDPKHQLTIPDNSSFGNKAFTRSLAVAATGSSYNAVKEHLRQLEGEGIIESRVINEQQKHSRVRRQGIQIYYRFTKGPPYGANSPFDCLPTEEQIAEGCKAPLQT